MYEFVHVIFKIYNLISNLLDDWRIIKYGCDTFQLEH